MTLAARTFASVDEATSSPAEAAVGEILFPTDLSPASDRAFEHARLLAERLGARLTLFHAVNTGHLSEARGPADPEVARRLDRAARAHLGRQAATLRTRHRIVVDQSNQADRALLAQIQTSRPDLVVMATHGREGMAHVFLGSVTERILEAGGCPVLFVREPASGVSLPYRRILLPVDLGGTSRLAFPLAALLARSLEAEVLAVHVAQPKSGSPTSISSLIEETVPTEGRLGRTLLPDFAGLRVKSRVEIGSPGDRIVETARCEEADVIVLSAHGADGRTHANLGSDAERVVRQAPCPVLVV